MVTRSIDPEVAKMLAFASKAARKLGFANSDPSPGESRSDRDRARFEVAVQLEPEWVPLSDAAAASCPKVAQQVIDLRTALANATHDPREHARLSEAYKALEVAAYRAIDTTAEDRPEVRLSDAEQDIFDVINEAGRILPSQSAVLDALSAKGKIPSQGTTKVTLAAMVRHGILKSGPDGRGYVIP